MSDTLKKTASLTAEQKRALLARLLREKQKETETETETDQAGTLPSDRSLAHRLFESQAARSPGSIAVVDARGQSLSYGALDLAAGRLARQLHEQGAGPGMLVALCLERSSALLVALLAVLKTGAAYLPLDPEYPVDRLDYMLRDSGASILLTQQGLAGSLSGTAPRTLLIDASRDDLAPLDASEARTPSPFDLAYVIYTSGSTGRPKGVMIPHAALGNFLEAMRRLLEPKASDVLLAVTTLSFDIAVLELLLPLTTGGRIELADRDEAVDGVRLLHRLHATSATMLQATPATWRLLLEAGWTRLENLAILCGGEALNRDLADRLLERGGAVWNLYGPTETTVWSAAARIEPGPGSVPVGRPVLNTRLYVLDARMRPAPVGVAGELYIGGDGLARGYLGRPALTAERFVPDPFGPPGGRLYATGDLARWRSDGQLECLGRLDHQVKIRGHRIELGEVEAALGGHPGVREAVAVARADASGENRLIAYVVPRVDPPLVLSELRQALQKVLSEPMIPSAFVLLESLPLTPNGKVDRKALPDPGDQPTPREGVHVPPRGPAEETLARVWAELLGRAQVSAEDSFFDLGGHSLLAARLASRIREAFAVELPLRALFENPTVAGQALRIDEALRDRTSPSPEAPAPRREAPLDGLPPASFAQQRLWFLDQLEPGSPLYNMPLAIRLDGPLDALALERALNEVVRRHDALRTSFDAEDGRPVQIVAPHLRLPLPLTDLSTLDADRRALGFERAIEEESNEPFDLARGPLIRARLLRLGEREHVVVVSMHHIISDGWSAGVLVREAGLLYDAMVQGRPSPLPELHLQYADFAVWQREWLQGEVLEGQLDYWTRQLAGVPALELPNDRPRPPVMSHRGGERSVILPGRLAARLRALGRPQGATLFMTLLAAFQTLLHRLSGQDDLAVGSPIAGRTRAETEDLIGFFVNTLVLRARLAGDPSFRTLLGRVKQDVLEAFANQDVPFEQLVDRLQVPRDPSRTPLFQVMFVLQNAPLPLEGATGLTLTPLNPEAVTSKFDLTLKVMENQHGLRAALEYATDLFDAATIDRMLARFHLVLEALVDDPDVPLSAITILTEDERSVLLAGNPGSTEASPNTVPTGRLLGFETRGEFAPRALGADAPETLLVHRLFEAQAARTPSAVAVVAQGRTLTYAELDGKANQLARGLAARGVGPDVLVGLCLDRSVEMVVGILGVLKAGGAYLPLDPEYPADRLAFLLEDARAGVLLTVDRHRATVPGASARIPVLALDTEWDAIAARDATPLDTPVESSNLAYVIYTSGSTGRPKGVAVAHRNLVSSTLARFVDYPEPVSRFLLLSSFAFDSSVAGLFWTLCQGGALVLVPAAAQGDPSAIADLVTEHAVSHLLCVPSLLALVLAEAPASTLESLSVVIVAGETCPRDLPARVQARIPSATLYNEYGPTEATVWCSVHRCDPADVGPVPIGRPITAARIYLLDARLQPVPIGVPGELFVGGEGVARGYLARPGLTAERFVPDPFSITPGARLYRTGDLARWRSNGTLEFLGRLDDQVKIRGHRIELGEVEAALVGHPALREAAAIAREDTPGDRRLVAYIVPEGDSVPTTSELRAWLKARLPDPMVPSVIVPLHALPLSPNGKVDRRALPRPRSDRPELDAAEAPRSPVEQVVAAVWSAVLGVDRVGLHEDFFDLGGHSLLATQVASRLRDAFSIEIPLRALFDATTVSSLARRIEAIRRGDQGRVGPPIEAGPRDAPPPVSYAQQALWLLDRLAPGQPTFNVNSAARIRGTLDIEALRLGLSTILHRHEALRTTFAMADGGPVQVIAPAADFPLDVLDLRAWPEAEREAEAERLVLEEERRPFDLAAGPLVRAVVLRLGELENVLVLTMHHIVTDGWSFGVAIGELAAAYEAAHAGTVAQLPSLPIQYADFARWQRGWLQGEVLDALLGYWTKQLAGVPALELPTDRPRPAVRAGRGADRTFLLSPDLTARIVELGRREGATTFMVLLGAFQTLLHRISGQDDFAVGSPIANRNRAETEGLIGYFVNMLALRANLSGDPTFRELLGRVREVALGAYEHQDLSLDKLIEVLQPPRDLSRTPLFQVMFVLQNHPLPDVSRQGLTLEPILAGRGNGTAKFDITLAMEETRDGLFGGVEYNSELFDDATIARLIDGFQVLLEGIVAHPDSRLSALPILAEGEHRLLLEAAQGIAEGLPAPVCVHALFETRAAETPEAEALVAGSVRMTYGELNRRANQFAHHLARLGIGPEIVVAIAATDPIGRMVAILGVLKAGGAYLPIDPSLPKARLASVLEDAGSPWVVIETPQRPALPLSASRVVCLETEAATIAARPSGNPSPRATLANLAYLISTSGSLGQPKGVQVTHASLASAYAAWESAFALRERPTRHLQMASFGFDVFTGDWVRALGSGGALVFCPREILLEPEALHDLIVRERVDMAEFVPAVIENLIPYLEESGRSLELMRLVAVGSDVWHAGEFERLRRLAGASARVVSSYGLTEATIDSTYFEGSLADRPANRPVPIGHPLPGSRVYVLDRTGNLVPVGVPGELHVGGPGLARGYHGRPGLTAEKFIPDPFSKTPGARLYRTGDLARWLPDGNLELIGRLDHQVKIRGFRIELAEVEAALLQHPDVREAVAVVAGDRSLAAYLVPRQGREITPEALRRALHELLPRPMIPSSFVVLDALPLTASGKLDRNALPAIDRARIARDGQVVAPRDDVERALVEIWESLLNVRPIGVTDDFFELGGHSLLAVRLTARIEERFGRKLPLSVLFLEGTIEDLAATLRGGGDVQADGRTASPLVSIRAGGSEPPLHLVHPIGGNVLCYHELARHLDPGRPVFGLQAPGLDGDAPSETSLAAMAARYVEAIREEQPAGPYHLGGWSLGGVVAFEMARQLHALGAEVATLVLIDSRAPIGDGPRPSIDEEALRTAFLRDLARGRTSGQGREATPERIAAELGPERLRTLQDVFRTNTQALLGYTPGPYSGRVVLVRAGGPLAGARLDRTLGWGPLAAGGVETHVLAGDHYSIMVPPGVGELARTLEAAMRQGVGRVADSKR